MPCALQILLYAQSTFRSVVGHDKDDSDVRMALACMLIALEEEAAFEVELKRVHRQGGGDLAFIEALSTNLGPSPASLENEVHIEFTNRCLPRMHR